MRRYLWILISCILPFAFWIMMKTRPPRSPGVVERLSPEEVRQQQGRGAATSDADAGP